MKATMIFNHFKNILDELIDETNFFKFYFQNPATMEEDVYWEDWEEFDSLYTNSTSLRFGATRGCLIDDTYDWVVKFDLDEAAEHGTCDDEINFYDHAAQNHLEKYFAQPIYLGRYSKTFKFYNWCDIYEIFEDGYPFFDETWFVDKLQEAIDNYDLTKKEITITIPLYAYPRAERYDFYQHDYEACQNQETLKKVSDSNSPLIERNSRIGFIFAEKYGEEEFFRLSEFLEEMHIDDLHINNVMEVNGELVITDYSGYRD